MQRWSSVARWDGFLLEKTDTQVSATKDFMAPFTAMLKDALGNRLAQDATFKDMLADDVEIEHPYAPSGPLRISGKAAMISHIDETENVFDIRRSSPKSVLYANDGKTVIIEFELEGRWLQNEGGYIQRCVAFIEINQGYITQMREYWNPLAPGMPQSTQKIP